MVSDSKTFACSITGICHKADYLLNTLTLFKGIWISVESFASESLRKKLAEDRKTYKMMYI